MLDQEYNIYNIQGKKGVLAKKTGEKNGKRKKGIGRATNDKLKHNLC